MRAVQPVLIALERDVEEAAASLGASPLTIFRRIILPALRPAMLAGVGLAFGRAVGEFGSVVLISGNLPYKTEVASVLVFGQIESDNVAGAAAVSVVLLAISFVVLLGDLVRRAPGGRRDEPDTPCASSRSATWRVLLVVPVGDGLLPRVRARLRRRLGRRHDAAGPARVLPDDHHHADRRAAERDLRRAHRAGCSRATTSAGKRLLDVLIDLPFAVSPVIVGLALILVWGRNGWFGTPPA